MLALARRKGKEKRPRRVPVEREKAGPNGPALEFAVVLFSIQAGLRPAVSCGYCLMRKNKLGVAGLIELVRLKLPLASKVLVRTGVQFINGRATFVELSSTKTPPGAPLVPDRTSLEPETVLELILATGGARTLTV